MARRWNDCPLELQAGHELCHLSLPNGFRCAVAKLKGRVWLTTGNLFGSQTVSVCDAEAALRLIEVISTALKTNEDRNEEAASLSVSELARKHPTWGIQLHDNATEDEVAAYVERLNRGGLKEEVW